MFRHSEIRFAQWKSWCFGRVFLSTPRSERFSLTSLQRCEIRRAAHLSSRGRVPSLRPLVAVAVASSARCSRNVRISCTLMPYHHKAPQHECARHAGRIVERGWRVSGAGCWAAVELRRAALLTAASSARRARRHRTHARRPPRLALRCPYSHLATTYLDIINKIIVRHELVR